MIYDIQVFLPNAKVWQSVATRVARETAARKAARMEYHYGYAVRVIAVAAGTDRSLTSAQKIFSLA